MEGLVPGWLYSLCVLLGTISDRRCLESSPMIRRKLTEFEKVQIVAQHRAEHLRQFWFWFNEIEVIVEDYTDDRGNPRVTIRVKS
ncbi:hypothetical protein ACVJGD_008395 [Bradyrhizobium sp. USDA 10063]